MKTKLVIASFILGILTIGIFTVKAQNGYSTNDNDNDDNIEYTKRSVYDKKEDGWVYGFEIIYVTKDSSINYIFDGYNLKHRPSSTEYYVSYKDEKGNEMERIPSRYATLSTSVEYREDIKKINNFFNENRFTQTISLSDLSKLDITEISKEYLVDLFNRTINSEIKTTPGNYLDMPSLDWKIQTSTDENLSGEWQVMYIMDYGYIQDIEIEFINNDESYLSDQVRTRNASNNDIQLLEKIEDLEDKIVKNQTISSASFDSSSLINNSDLNNLLSNLFIN